MERPVSVARMQYNRREARIMEVSGTQFMNWMQQQQMPAWGELVLVWVGFGTLVGLLAKAIMPGRDPGGTVATLCMGVGGTIIGCGLLAFFFPEQRATPVTPLGFVVGTVGAFTILVFYRILAGYWFVEGDVVTRRQTYRRRRARRHYHEAHLDEV